MNILSGELEPTKTYASRSWVWVGKSDPTAVEDGTLTVNFVTGKTARAAVESRRYFAQEIGSEFGRMFLFLKAEPQTDPNEPDCYQVALLDNGLIACSCKADACHAPSCIHKDVLPALIAAGAFDAGAIVPADETSGLWFPSEPPKETCGYCAGSGRVRAMKVSEGNPHMRVPDHSRTQDCEYCGGSGQTEDGAKLQAAR